MIENIDTVAIDKLDCSEQDNEVQIGMEVGSSSDTDSQDELSASTFVYWVNYYTDYIDR